MISSNIKRLNDFTLDNLPDLDVAVLGALELFSEVSLPRFEFDLKRPLVVGSGNALVAGKIMFGYSAIYADESSFAKVLEDNKDIVDGVVVVSASGSKHSVGIVEEALKSDIRVFLFTNAEGTSAGAKLPPANVFVFPKNREPYTYNTSTYLGMILSATHENVDNISGHIERQIRPKLLRNFGHYTAFTFILPAQFAELRDMFRTKFDELFGAFVVGRFFTEEELKHAKTVVPCGSELFISLGYSNDAYGLARNRLNLPLSDKAGYAEAMMVGYFVIGQIQKSHPPYFKNNIVAYTEVASKLFGQQINPVVE